MNKRVSTLRYMCTPESSVSPAIDPWYARGTCRHTTHSRLHCKCNKIRGLQDVGAERIVCGSGRVVRSWLLWYLKS